MGFKLDIKTVRRGAAVLLLCFLIVMLAVKPDVYVKSVFNGLLMFCTAVLPALFPFFFFTKTLTALGAGDLFSRAFKKPLAKLYAAPPVAAYIFVMSVLSGYPVGAKLLEECRTQGLISARQAKSVVAFASTSGPLFIVGTVAVNMFADKRLGYLLMLCHFAAALLNGFIYRPYKNPEKENDAVLPSRQEKLLADCVYDAVISILIVGGFIAVFSMVADVLVNLKIVGFLAKPLGALFSAAGLDPRLSDGVIIGLLEVTRGCLEISALSPPTAFSLPVVSALISFGGIAVIAQSVSFVNRCGIKTGYFLLTKFTHALIACALGFAVSLLL